MRYCEHCNCNFEPAEETVCDKCFDEFQKDRDNSMARLQQELDAAQSGAVGLNIRIAELHQQLADAKAQIADYEKVLKYYATIFDIDQPAKTTLKKWKIND